MEARGGIEPRASSARRFRRFSLEDWCRERGPCEFGGDCCDLNSQPLDYGSSALVQLSFIAKKIWSGREDDVRASSNSTLPCGSQRSARDESRPDKVWWPEKDFVPSMKSL